MPHPFAHLSAALATATGRVRRGNEDAGFMAIDQGVFAVADGMGGGSCGEVASRCIVQELDSFRVDRSKPDDDARRLDETVQRANAHLYQLVRERNLTGMGSTVVLMTFHSDRPQQAVVLHAGDSRAYRLRGRTLEQLMTDHSVVAENRARNIKTLPFLRNAVTRAVGTEQTVQLEHTAVRVTAGDLYLLCSDGLYNMLPDWWIKRLLRKHRAEGLQACANHLVEAANQRGGKDNITAVLIDVGDPHPTKADEPAQ